MELTFREFGELWNASTEQMRMAMVERSGHGCEASECRDSKWEDLTDWFKWEFFDYNK
jgi:hypothetical protein